MSDNKNLDQCLIQITSVISCCCKSQELGCNRLTAVSSILSPTINTRERSFDAQTFVFFTEYNLSSVQISVGSIYKPTKKSKLIIWVSNENQ
jgi:hypothetical protein